MKSIRKNRLKQKNNRCLKAVARRVGAVALCGIITTTTVISAWANFSDTFNAGDKYITDYSSYEDALEAAKEVDLLKDEEGMVLLKNDGMLPMSTASSVTVFGREAEDVALAMEEEGFNVNPNRIATDYATAFSTDEDYPSKSEEQSIDNYGDVAVVTLTRYYGETCDAPTVILPNMSGVEGESSMSYANHYDAYENIAYQGDTGENHIYATGENGEAIFQHHDLYSTVTDGEKTEYKHSLMMTEAEERMLKYAKENFDFVIVAWTGATTFELALLQDDDGINAIIHTNQWGENGATAFAEILSGKVNPSGKTEAIWYSDMTADPTWYNSAWQRQIYGFDGTTLGSFVSDGDDSTAYGYTLEELSEFGPDSDYQEAAEEAGKETTNWSALISQTDLEEGNDYTVWPANAGPVSSLSTMFAEGIGYDYRSVIEYDEGIYLGYKYYETVYAEIAAGNLAYENGELTNGSGNENEADEWYERAVTYPFGYGLSYTDFSWELTDVEVTSWNDVAGKTELYEMTSDEVMNSQLTFKVKVTNTGSIAGKDVVEIYAHAPYTSGEVEKSDVVLVSFEKTATLSPGQSQVLTLTVNMEDFASFDYNDANNNGESTYEFDAGQYEIRFQTDSHNVKSEMTSLAEGFDGGVLNLADLQSDVIMGYDDFTGNESTNSLSQDNIYNSLGWDIDTTLVGYDGDDTASYITRTDEDSEGNADMILMTRADFIGTYPGNTYSYADSFTRSDEYFALLNSLDGYDADLVNFDDSTSVADIYAAWAQGSNYTSGVEGASNSIIDSVTGEAVSGFKGFHVGMWGSGEDADPDNTEYLNFIETGEIAGVTVSQHETYGEGETADTKFIDMFGVDLSDEDQADEWQNFLNELSWYDVLEICSNGGSTCEVSSIEKTMSQGGDSPREWNGYDWGSMSTMACTWNKELCYTIGTMYGNLGKLNNGNNGADWWGPGGDTHRTPFCGRYNDYFSSDGYQGGMIAAAIISGAESRGVTCMIKHIALNDQEAFRGGSRTYCTEQAMRENQLKIFQIALQEGGAKATMGSLACVGDIYANCNYAFSVQIIRQEWGWLGYYATDGYGVSAAYWPMDLLVRNGGWPLGSDPQTDNSQQNYLSGSYHFSDGESDTDKAGVYTGCIDDTATGSAIGETYTYETDIAGTGTARENPTQWYYARKDAEYVLYAQSTTGTAHNGIDLTLFSSEGIDEISTKQDEDISLNIAVASYSEDCGDNVSYAVTDGALPDGIALSEDGTISGKTAWSGAYEATVTCTIDNWMTSQNTVTIDVASNFILDYLQDDLDNATVGTAFSGQGGLLYLESDDDETAYTYEVVDGALPLGIEIDSETGVISGTPEEAGQFTAIISATASAQESGGQGDMDGFGLGMGQTSSASPAGYYSLTIDVADSNELEFRVEEGFLQYKSGDSEWKDAVAVSDLTG